MEPVLCLNCYEFFPPSPKHKGQWYCMKPECRKAKKAAWRRAKMRTDPQFRKDQQLSNKKWVQNNPDYWTRYRKRKPEKAQRNRILQRIRNRRRAKRQNKAQVVSPPMIAKIDASNSNRFGIVGQFWLVPMIAKIDALKVNIVEIPIPYQ